MQCNAMQSLSAALHCIALRQTSLEEELSTNADSPSSAGADYNADNSISIDMLDVHIPLPNRRRLPKFKDADSLEM